MISDAPSARTQDGPLLEVRNLSKSFVGTQALSSVSLETRPNEIVGLVGENGAGKSTLLKILSGNHSPDSGEIPLHGRPTTIRSVMDATRRGISLLSQEGSLLPNLPVADNIFLGHESQFERFGVINGTRMREAARAQLQLSLPSTSGGLRRLRRGQLELAGLIECDSQQSGHALDVLRHGFLDGGAIARFDGRVDRHVLGLERLELLGGAGNAFDPNETERFDRLTSPNSWSGFKASRMAERPTPKAVASCCSDGMRSPTPISPEST